MQADKIHPKSQAKPNLTSYNVLLVEDEGLIARDIAQRLEALGHRISSIVSTGEEAIEAAPGADVVLMDIRLDGPMDGIQAAETIRRRYQIPVIFLTAHADRSMVERAKQAQPCGYIVKPVAPAALHTSIEIAVYKHAMEREVVEREAWLRAVLTSVADAVAVTDAEGRVRILNPAAESLTGWSEEDARGQDLASVIPLLYASFESGNAGSFDSQTPVPRETDAREGPIALAMLRDAAVALDRDALLKTRGGRYIPVDGMAAPVRVGPTRDGNAAIGAVLSLRDVSRQRWEEQQVHQAQKAQAVAKLAAGVAEEYTNLLAVIRTQSERLLDQFGDYSPVRQASEEIRQATLTAEQITRKLAGFGKRQPARMEVLSPNGVLRHLAKLLETVVGSRVEITIRPGLHAGRVKADEGQLEQLLMNLTMYAGRGSANGGQIRIETGSVDRPPAGEAEPSGEEPGRYVRIAIVYEPISNTQAPNTLGSEINSERNSKGDAEGKGVPFGTASSCPEPVEDDSLALSMAHSIVTEHNGFFSARNRAGGGVCLEVLLPRWIEPETFDATAPPLLTHTVLLVEPREIVRAELHKFFEAHGLDLLEAADLAEAIGLAEVREGPLDLIIAPAFEAGLVLDALREAHPEAAGSCKTLCIVHGTDQKAGELRRSYTQAALLERVRALLKDDPSDRQTAAAATF